MFFTGGVKYEGMQIEESGICDEDFEAYSLSVKILERNP